ncbi:MAG: MarR family transcriptional regulator [Propionibacteriaceae bacterium]|nr:MarR family transcriptional regulator [Propionibacteriaceae bacterium]
MREDKRQRLEEVARLYYERDLTQAKIARQLGVSRPFVSRLLAEAKAAGIVEITIHSQVPASQALRAALQTAFRLQDAALVADGEDGATNQALGLAALELIERAGGGRLGLGWGHVIGSLVADLEQRPPVVSAVTDVTPLVGNGGVPIRHYHSNENTRIVAQQLQARAHYLHAPSLAETAHDLDLVVQTEHYQSVKAEWERLDVALVNIGTYPSTPDFASVARYGNLLTVRRAVGRLIAYYFNQQGEIIHSDQDYAIQVPLAILAKVPRIIGIASANVSPEALLGALRTGCLTDLVAREGVVAAALDRAT